MTEIVQSIENKKISCADFSRNFIIFGCLNTKSCEIWGSKPKTATSIKGSVRPKQTVNLINRINHGIVIQTVILYPFSVNHIFGLTELQQARFQEKKAKMVMEKMRAKSLATGPAFGLTPQNSTFNLSGKTASSNDQSKQNRGRPASRNPMKIGGGDDTVDYTIRRRTGGATQGIYSPYFESDGLMVTASSPTNTGSEDIGVSSSVNMKLTLKKFGSEKNFRPLQPFETFMKSIGVQRGFATEEG